MDEKLSLNNNTMILNQHSYFELWKHKQHHWSMQSFKRSPNRYQDDI